MTTYSCAVLTISDKGAAGQRLDTSGPALLEMLAAAGFRTGTAAMVADEITAIADVLRDWIDQQHIDLIVTTGGTGLSPRDVTPEATLPLLDRVIPGISEVMRLASLTKTPHAALSRGLAGIRGQSLVINLPGSKRGATENLDAVLPILQHALEKIKGEPGDCGG